MSAGTVTPLRPEAGPKPPQARRDKPRGRRASIAVHEAGHAVLLIVLGLGCKRVTIVPDYKNREAGAATHGGEGRAAQGPDEKDDATAELRMIAEEEFWLRHATACYAGAEAVRRLGVKNWRAGAEDDDRKAVDAINSISVDDRAIDLLFELAKRRAAVLVEHYWPEITALAKRLQKARTLTGAQAHKVLRDSLLRRRGGRRTW